VGAGGSSYFCVSGWAAFSFWSSVVCRRGCLTLDVNFFPKVENVGLRGRESFFWFVFYSDFFPASP